MDFGATLSTRSWCFPRLSFERLHVFEINAEGVEWWHVEAFLLDIEVLDVGILGGGEDGPIVHGSVAKLSGRRWIDDGGWRRCGPEVFDVKQ